MTEPVLLRSAFDSDVFGVPFFRVGDPDPDRVDAALREMPGGALIVDAKLPAADLERVGAFDRLGFRKVSVLVEFAGPARPDAVADVEVARELTLGAADLDAHAEGFRFQRFMQDGRIPRARSVELMRRWIGNSLAGRRETLAIGRNFCTYQATGGRLTIDLVSVLDGSRGIAGRLMAAVHAEAAARGAREIRVTTEAENVRAMRLYLAAGFLPMAAHAAMHLVRAERETAR